jgi:hypothetical protein
MITVMLPVGMMGGAGTSAGPPRLMGTLALALSEISKRIKINSKIKEIIYNELKPVIYSTTKQLPSVYSKITRDDVLPPDLHRLSPLIDHWWPKTERPRLFFSEADLRSFVDEIVTKVQRSGKCKSLMGRLFCFS